MHLGIPKEKEKKTMKRSHILYGKKLPPLLILLLLVLTLPKALSLNMVGVSAGEYPAIYIDPANTTDPTLTPGSNYTISIKTDYIGERVNDTWTGDGANTTFVTTLKPVVENSEEVYVNGALMTRDVDYTIDYATGTITFTTAPASGVEVKAIYTHGDIWGWSFSLTYDPQVLHGGVKKTDTWIAGTNTTDTWIGDNVTKSFITTEKPVVPDSEKVYVDLTLMTKPENYTIKYSTGNITLTTAPGEGANVTAIYLPLPFSTTGTPVVPDSEEVYVNQTLMTRITERTDVWIGDGVTRTFITTQPVFPETETVLVDRRDPSWWDLDYTIDYSTGNVTFDPAPDWGAEIEVKDYDTWGNYTINYEEGTITFPTNLEYEIFPPPDGVEIKATYLYDGATNGDLITKNIHKSAQFIPGTFNNTIGKLSTTTGWFFYLGTPQPVTSGPGTLANVTFTVVGRGISNITLGPETALKNPIPGDPPLVVNTQHGYFDNTVGWINGTVTDASTGNPIENATVTADGYSTTTNINGEYIIPADLAPETYRVEASKPGYISSSKFAEVFGEETTTVDFALTPLPPGKGAIAGMIIDALTGDPIEGATVTVDGYSTTTDADGYYNITIDPGTYTVTTSATGYESDSKSTTVDSGETTTVNFTLTVEETPTPGTPGYLYMAAAAVVAIVMVAIAFYFLRIRKPKPT